METIQDGGIGLIQSLQTFSPALDSLMRLFTFLGTVEFFLIFLPIIYWNVNRSVGFRAVLLLLTTESISTSFKLVLHQPRPYWLGEVEHLADETTYGIPSSHASDSVALWGYLAYRLRKGWAYAAVTILVLLIGLSRLYLGVHFPHDVLVGWGIGLVTLALFALLENPVARWLEDKGDPLLIGLGLIGSILVVIAGVLLRTLIGGSPDPVEWAPLASEARSLIPFITLGGSLLGTVSGYVLMRSRASFDPEGSLGIHILRYLLGIAGVILLYKGLDVLFAALAPDETTLGLFLRYLRYTATTFWVLFGAPWLFLRLRLAETEARTAG